MRLIFLGPPGAGKGTQAKLVSNHYSIPHISTGDMVRDAISEKSELGKKIENLYNAGRLVPDEVILELIKERITKKDCEKGFILDGFPRNVSQAKELDKILIEANKIDKIVFFEISESELSSRITKRREAEARKDDTAEVLKDRLEVYRTSTLPLVEYYKKTGLLDSVNAEGQIEEVNGHLLSILG